MATSTTITCDFCGAVHRQTNHWWKLYVELGETDHKGDLVIGRSDNDSSILWKDACGDKCVLIGVQRYLATNALD